MLFQIYFSLFVLRLLSINASDCKDKPHCGINEVWDCLCLPRPTCDEPCGGDGAHVCPLDPDGNCVKECICRPGFLRASNGLCTHCTQCSHLDKDDCCDDEVFQNCGTFCPETCASRGESVTCTEQCVKGCFCRHDQVRNINGSCVDPDECPGKGGDGGNKGDTDCSKGCGGDPNAHPGCGLNCGKTCATYKNPPKVCPLGCILHGCDCNDGYVKDPNVGKCVKPKDCTPICTVNETFSQHPVTCPPQTCDAIGKAFACPVNSTGPPACICKDGFLRNKENKCVLKADCDTCGADRNARPGCGNPCGRTCDDICKPIHSCPAFCLDGCDCISGFVLDTVNNKCVPPKDCPKPCKGCRGDPNAEFVKCPDSCPATCANGGVKPVVCPRLCLLEGCQCLPGFVLDDQGKCIKLKDCPPKGCGGDPNAHPGCGINCGKTCATYKNPPKICPKGCILHGCNCNDGYVKDPNIGKCVKPKDCTPVCTVNETFSHHPETCPPQTCDAIGKAFACLANRTGPHACICKNGYLRNKDNKCVLKADCDTCGDDRNARPGCGNSCGRTCDDICKPIHSCPAFCLDGCDCIPGFVLDTVNQKCVLPKGCPKPCKGCRGDPNAEFVKCPDPCPATCANGGVKPEVCPRLCLLEGCQCLPGFVLNDQGKCIRLKHCPSKGCGGDPNAHSGCGMNCERTCSDYKDPPCDCDKRIGCIQNGCDCNDGYVKDGNLEKCVKPDECTPQCGPNEHLDTCPVDCPSDFCPTKDEPPVACSPPHPCNKPKCKCDFNFRKAKNGTCIPTGDCRRKSFIRTGSPVCTVNETFSQHPETCPPQTCDAIGKAFACPANSTGPPACICKDGYLRNKENKCVLKADCDTCGDDRNARPGCGNSCGRTCDDICKPIHSCPAFCLDGCDCIPGFVLDTVNKKCVLPKGCPKPCKGCRGDPNAEFVKCPDPCPATCANGGVKPVCPRLCLLEGCQCLPGFVLNDQEKCIRLKDCPPKGCGGDPNAHPGCGMNCGRTCSDYKDPPCDCDKRIGCIQNGCDCNDGYVKDGNLEKCVKPDECTPQCGPNEHLDTCPVDCPSDFCPTKDEPPVACSPPHPCNKPKCKCDFIFKKAKNGTCIPTRDCPPFKCKGKNEVFDACPPICPGENCADAKLKRTCPFEIGIVLICNPRCRCGKGFFRDKDHVCIPADCCPDK